MIKNLSTPAPTQPGGYAAPVGEYAFLLGEAFGTDIVARSTGGALTAEDALDAIGAAGEFAAEVFAPLNRAGDEIGAKCTDGVVTLPEGYREAYQAFVEAGWLSAAVPESAGGDGLPETVTAALAEFWNGSNMAFALNPALTLGAIRALSAKGSEELRSTYLPKMVSGEWTGTMNLTEPQAGTDLGAVRSFARDNGDGTWAVNGQKIFITWGDHDVADNIIHLVLARTEGAPEGHAGLSLFLVPKYLPNADGTLGERNSVITVGVEHKIGIHGSPTCTLQYEDAKGFLIGELHGGLQAMFVMMNEARFNMGVQGVGLSQRALQRANEYALTRLQGPVLGREAGEPIAGHPDVRRILLSMSSRVSAIRAFCVYAADLRDREEEEGNKALAELCIPILKAWGSEEAIRITSDGIQVHGGMGFVEETGAGQHWRDSRIIAIYEGTTAIHSNDLIGRKVLRDGGATVGRFFAEMNAQVEALRASSNEVAQRTAERLARATAAAQSATDAIIALAANPRDAYSVSVPYLELLSVLVGGWMHAIMVSAVLKHDALSEDDQRRLTEADFYGAHHLPQVHALAETVAAGEIS